MTSREATLHYLKQLKGQPLKEQLSYILTNFWIPIVALLAAIVFLVSLVVHWTTQNPTVLTLCCINAVATEDDTGGYLQGFAQAQGIDTDQSVLRTEFIYLGQDSEADYHYMQLFTAMQTVGDLDVAVAEYDIIIDYAYEDSFADLSEILTAAQLDALAPHFLYIDQSVLEIAMESPNALAEYPDPTKPEEMEQPIPVAIKLQPNWGLTESCYPYTYQINAVALFANAGNMANAQAFLQYILEGN